MHSEVECSSYISLTSTIFLNSINYLTCLKFCESCQCWGVVNPFFLPQKYQGKCKTLNIFNEFVEQMNNEAKRVRIIGFWRVTAYQLCLLHWYQWQILSDFFFLFFFFPCSSTGRHSCQCSDLFFLGQNMDTILVFLNLFLTQLEGNLSQNLRK